MTNKAVLTTSFLLVAACIGALTLSLLRRSISADLAMVPETHKIEDDATAQTTRTAVSVASSTATDASTEVDRAPSSDTLNVPDRVRLLIAGQQFEELIKLYHALTGKGTTIEDRKAILDALSNIEDPTLAENLMLEAIGTEKPTYDGIQLVHHTGVTLALNVWMRGGRAIDGEAVNHARDGLVFGTNPRAQQSLMVALLMAKPEGLAGDLLRTLHTTEDLWLRLNLIGNVGFTGDEGITRDMAEHEIRRPIVDTVDEQYVMAGMRGLAGLAQSDKRHRESVIGALIWTACRSDSTRSIVTTAIESLRKLDPESIRRIKATISTTNDDILAVIDEAIAGLDKGTASNK